jgi:GntR family phosphonate transport system transcriptional regulator
MSEDTMTGIPLWRRIAATIGAEITDGRLAPGAQMPTEMALAARFAVNRHTVRRAIEALSRDGLVTTEQGRGSFVTEDVMDYVVGPRTRFSEWVRRNNREPSGRVLDLRTAQADSTIAEGLRIAAGDAVVRMERLGLADGLPVGVSTHWFPATLPGIAEALARETSITDALAAAGVLDYRRSRTRVSARLPSVAEAALLRTARNRPLLVCENTNVDTAGRIVELGFTCHPTPRVQVVFEP